MMNILTHQLGITNYESTFLEMKEFTANRDKDTPDEIWLTQHHPVFTQGQAGKAEHLLYPSEVPVIQSDRGGQITYHGLGQIVLYTLIDIKRAKVGVRQMVSILENSIIATLATLNITAEANPDAPGVYVGNKKIASLGLRVSQGRTYHGLALNVNMDLTPFQLINPCGHVALQMTQVCELTPAFEYAMIEMQLVADITSAFSTT